MLQFDKHTALLCGTETNLFETNRQNVTVQMQNHDGNRLARSNFATATRISFWKDVLVLLSQRILGVSEIGPFSKNSGVWFGLVGGAQVLSWCSLWVFRVFPFVPKLKWSLHPSVNDRGRSIMPHRYQPQTHPFPKHSKFNKNKYVQDSSSKIFLNILKERICST